MDTRPIIIYVEDDSGCEDYNNFRDALIAVLEKDCDCAVANYPYTQRMQNDEAKIKQAIKYGSVILFVVAQDEYGEGDHEQTIVYFRSLAPDMPIVVIPNNRENAFKADPTIRVMRHHDHEWISYIKHLRSEWTRNANWLRAGNGEERQLITDQLVDAHCANNPSDSSFGEPDDNERTVAEALRVRLLSYAGLARIEFDNTLDRTKPSFPTIEKIAYYAELERFRRLTETELAELDQFLQASIGCRPGGRGFCGSNVSGFAIDPVTQETYITYGSGNHRVAAQILAGRLELMGVIRNDRFADEMRYEWRLVQGRIIREVPGFSTPVLMLWQERAEDEDFKSAGVFIMSKRQFIPVSSYTKLVE